MGKDKSYLPPPKEPPLRDELELLERPKPPKELGLLVELEEAEVGLDEEPKERCEMVGLESALALAAVFSAFGESGGSDMTGRDDLLTLEPELRDVILPE